MRHAYQSPRLALMILAALLLSVASATLFYAAGQPLAASLAILVFLAASRIGKRGHAFKVLLSLLLASPMLTLIRSLVASCGAGPYVWLMPGIASLALSATVALLWVEETRREEPVYLPKPIEALLSVDSRLILLAALSAAAHLNVAMLYLAFLLVFTLTLLSALFRSGAPGRLG